MNDLLEESKSSRGILALLWISNIRFTEKLKRRGDQDEVAVSEPPKKKPKVQDQTGTGNFLYSDIGFVKVYTDGACTKNGKMGAKAGIGVWFNEDHPLNVSAPVKGPPTNNTAEIQAARIAITQAYRQAFSFFIVTLAFVMF